MNKKEFDYVIVGAGIAGCSLAHFLSKKSESILLIDKNEDVAFGASGAAGAFLSPLLGKPNKFKDLITKALCFSMNYYKKYFFEDLINCGTCRIPKNQEDEEKFQSYIPYMDFEYKKFEEGYLFEIGSVVKPYEICKKLSDNIQKLFNYEIQKIEKYENNWILNNEIKAKNLFLTTGADISLIEEKYLDIRSVWGQKIDVFTTSKVEVNYHKECSLSISNKEGIVSIGATHHRFDDKKQESSYDLKLKNINKLKHNDCTNNIMQEDVRELLAKANDIKTLNDVKVLDIKIGARASSVDYFPMLGKLVDSQKSFEKYPHLKNGFQIKNENLELIDNLYILNGVGGRGFVLSLYLANKLVENIFNNEELEEEITNFRLFKRWAKKQNK